VPWLVPSTDPDYLRFERLRYWRGPIWAVVNWMIADGFAARIRSISSITRVMAFIEAVLKSGAANSAWTKI
jgi:glycogen debranching enzyme